MIAGGGQRDEEFDLLGVAKGDGLVLKNFRSGWVADSGSLKQVRGALEANRRIVMGAELEFGRQVQWNRE